MEGRAMQGPAQVWGIGIPGWPLGERAIPKCVCWPASLTNCSSLRVGWPVDVIEKGQEIGQGIGQPFSELTQIDTELNHGEECHSLPFPQPDVPGADTCGGLRGERVCFQVRTFQFNGFLVPGIGGS